MTSRAEKLRRRHHRKEKRRRGAKRLVAELAQSAGLVCVNPTGVGKMSEALWALVKPEMDFCKDREAIRQLATIGATAWNVALVKGAERTAYMDELALKIPSDRRQDFKEIMEALIRRKEEMFPNNQRPIFNVELTSTPSGDPYLLVASGLA